eukprot:116619-Prorocentrum_lima.AAC.1
MTSSLVGSEMCIRDRTGPVPLTYSLACSVASLDLCPSQEQYLDGLSLPPVSYTHLTLPTICSV